MWKHRHMQGKHIWLISLVKTTSLTSVPASRFLRWAARVMASRRKPRPCLSDNESGHWEPCLPPTTGARECELAACSILCNAAWADTVRGGGGCGLNTWKGHGKHLVEPTHFMLSFYYLFIYRWSIHKYKISQVNHFKVYSLVELSTFTLLYNQPPHPSPKLFHHPNRNLKLIK